MERLNKTVKVVSRNYKYANTWGGSIYVGDFATCAPSGNTVNKIVNAWSFDHQCIRKGAIKSQYDRKSKPCKKCRKYRKI